MCKPKHHLKLYLDFIKENHDIVSGDLCEIGTYQGSSLLATALFLKEIGSNKKIYSFDSFSGFPPVFHENDNAEKFESLFNSNKISDRHFADINKRLMWNEVLNNVKISQGRITSVSNNFENNSLEILEKKIELLNLDNIILVQGRFEDTMSDNQQYSYLTNITFMAAWLDCDIYNSYKTSLPFVWDKLIKGGYMYIDEYYSLKYPGCRIACDEFFYDKEDKPELQSEESMDFERWCVRKT